MQARARKWHRVKLKFSLALHAFCWFKFTVPVKEITLYKIHVNLYSGKFKIKIFFGGEKESGTGRKG